MANKSGHNGEEVHSNGNGRRRAARFAGAAKTPFNEASLRDAYRILFRHRGKLTCVIAATMLAAMVYAFCVPKTYRSEAKLFLRLGRENVGLDATTNLGQSASVAITSSREEELNTAVEVLRSRVLLERVVDALGPGAILHPSSSSAEDRVAASSATSSTADAKADTDRAGWFGSLSPREQAILRLKKQVDVEAVKKTNVILVSHQGPSPEVSQQIVSKLIDFYIDTHVRMNRTSRAHEFLSQQAAGLKSQLTSLESELCVLKNATGLSAPSEQRQTLIAQIARLEDEIKSTKASIAATEAEARALTTRLTALNETEVLSRASGFPNVAADGMRQQLYTLQLKEKELASRVTDKHPELRAVREQIAAAKPLVETLEPTRTQVTTGPHKNFEDLRLQLLRDESSLASLRARSATLDKQLVAARQQLEALNNHEVKIAQLQREIQIRETSYRKYADGLEQARIDESLERQRISNVNVAEPPTVSRAPLGPSSLLTLVLGLGLAVFGGVAFVFIAEYVDHSFKTSEEVESRLNLPVLVSIPELHFDHLRSNQLTQTITR